MYLTLKQAAEYLGYKTQTLRNMKCQHPDNFPKYKVLKRTGNYEVVRFTPEDLDQWVEEQNAR